MEGRCMGELSPSSQQTCFCEQVTRVERMTKWELLMNITLVSHFTFEVSEMM